MTLAILCSGQGAQHANMFRLTADEAEARAVFEYADTLLGVDARAWVKSASAEQLHTNRCAQLLCTTQALAMVAALKVALPIDYCVAGYSVGEMAAWNVSGLLDARQTLDLVAVRADMMSAASAGDEGMLFIRGLRRDVIQSLCEGRQAAIAIVNPDDAFVLGGQHRVLSDLAIAARDHGAQSIVSIAVEVAAHTRWLGAASAQFRQHLLQKCLVTQRTTNGRLFSGIDGAPVLDVSQGLDKLAQQIAQPIRWDICLQSCVEAGATAFLELGPGHALKAMASATYPAIHARSVEDFQSLDGVRRWLAHIHDR